MQIIEVKKLDTWPAPTSTDVKDGKLLVSKLNEFFYLTIGFPGMKTGDQIDTTIVIKYDKYSPPVSWHSRFPAEQDNSETFKFPLTLFGGTFDNGTGSITFTAKDQPSAALEFSINP
ncbi:hypothetical protein OOJ96_23240 [Pseudomonas sp. 15FMM2]|uniref:Uncharacterized protein n=1 Tax=Pseudomonas imrae TaxID=2992837 RepID=A0ACC7PL07_9PSED